MARKKKGSYKKLELAEVTLNYLITQDMINAGKPLYVDIAQGLSAMNRKLHRQGYIYEIESLKWASGTTGSCTVGTLPTNWVTRNAWTKAYALWQQMNFKVLQDNPSVKGTWHDFKVFFDDDHFNGGTTGGAPDLNLLPVDMVGITIQTGEWYMSQFVLPQPDVDPTSGKPLAADTFMGHMLGPDVGGPVGTNPLSCGGIIQMYEDTRAQTTAGPTVPAGMSDSWGTQLTDDGSQEPELADIIEAANDVPPYDADDYVGGSANFVNGNTVAFLAVTANQPSDYSFNHIAPLGLLKVAPSAVGQLQVKLRRGSHDGVKCLEMSQSGSVKRLYHDLKGKHGSMS